MTITLKQLQSNAGHHGLILDHNDLALANKMRASGDSLEHIFACAKSWASEYAYVAECEARSANDLEYIYR